MEDIIYEWVLVGNVRLAIVRRSCGIKDKIITVGDDLANNRSWFLKQFPGRARFANFVDDCVLQF